jgi:hypothetical protein
MQTAFHAAYNNDKIKERQNEKAGQNQDSGRRKENKGRVETFEQTGDSPRAGTQYMQQFFMPDEESRMPGV